MTTQPPFVPSSSEPSPPPPRQGLLRFGVFELDLTREELRKAGTVTRLQPQPFKLLRLLATHPRRLFTREEIQRELWSDSTFVDFEQGINFCVRRVRATLGDQADSPRFVETLPRRGYRWIGPSEWTAVDGQTALPVLSVPAGERLTPGREARPTSSPALPRRARWAAVAALLMLLALAWAWRERAQSTSEASGPTWTRATLRSGRLVNARFSGGDELVYVAAWDGGPLALHSAHLGQPEARRLALEGAGLAGVSPRREVAFFTAGRIGTVARGAIDGQGGAKELADGVLMADWDGVDMAAVRLTPSGQATLEYPLGRAVTSLAGANALRISPDRSRVAVIEALLRDDDRGRVVVVDRDGRRREIGPVWASAPSLAWSPSSDEVWVSATRSGSDLGLWALGLDGGERQVLPPSGRMALHDIDARGRALIERRAERIEVLTRFGDGPERNVAPLGNGYPVAFSRDGRRVLLVETGEGAGPEYASYVVDREGGPAVRVGPGRGTDLSPDGLTVAAIPLTRPDRIDLLPLGSGSARSVRHEGIVQYAYALFHPDGKHLLFRASDASKAFSLWLGSLEGGPARRVAHDRFIISASAGGVMPDGRSCLARGADRRLYLVPFDGGAPQVLPDSDDINVAGFDDDGRTLFAWRRSDFPLQIERLDLYTGRRQPWRRAEPGDRVGATPMRFVRVAAGGRALAYTCHRRLSELFVVEGLR